MNPIRMPRKHQNMQEQPHVGEGSKPKTLKKIWQRYGKVLSIHPSWRRDPGFRHALTAVYCMLPTDACVI